MEFTAEARRGYFIRGLSGAQFVRSKDFERICTALNKPESDSVCLNAVDPAQAWGRILKHEPDRAFVCVPGTAVVMRCGIVRIILSRPKRKNLSGSEYHDGAGISCIRCADA